MKELNAEVPVIPSTAKGAFRFLDLGFVFLPSNSSSLADYPIAGAALEASALTYWRRTNSHAVWAYPYPSKQEGTHTALTAANAGRISCLPI